MSNVSNIRSLGLQVFVAIGLMIGLSSHAFALDPAVELSKAANAQLDTSYLASVTDPTFIHNAKCAAHYSMRVIERGVAIDQDEHFGGAVIRYYKSSRKNALAAGIPQDVASAYTAYQQKLLAQQIVKSGYDAVLSPNAEQCSTKFHKPHHAGKPSLEVVE